jgi:hypothetical protein
MVTLTSLEDPGLGQPEKYSTKVQINNASMTPGNLDVSFEWMLLAF